MASSGVLSRVPACGFKGWFVRLGFLDALDESPSVVALIGFAGLFLGGLNILAFGVHVAHGCGFQAGSVFAKGMQGETWKWREILVSDGCFQCVEGW